MVLKSLAAVLLSAAALAACGPGARSTITLVEGDSFVGPADAKVVVTEYGSPTCPVCKRWHDENWAQLKSAYLDPGKVKFVFREYAVHGAIDAAIIGIARCAGTADYFPLLDEAFARQDKIVQAAGGAGGPMAELKSLGQKFRLSGEQVESCIKDPKNIARVTGVMDEAAARGINATPTFLVNDRLLGDYSYATMTAAIDAALAPAAAPTPADAPTATPPAQPAPN